MPGFTNRGKYKLMEWFYRKATMPTNLYVALCTAANTPTADTNLMSDLVEIAAGNGYTSGGYLLNMNSTDFPVLTEDDTNDLALIQIKNIVFTASGGVLPASGNGFRYAVLTDDNAVVANRIIIAYWDLNGTQSLLDTQSFHFITPELRYTEV